MFSKIRKNRACCPVCNKWYDRDTMVVINYGQSNVFEVCIDCYEEKYFIPPEPLKKGDEKCQKLLVHL